MRECSIRHSYDQPWVNKLREEVEEFCTSDETEELADVLEVIPAPISRAVGSHRASMDCRTSPLSLRRAVRMGSRQGGLQ